VAIHKITYNAKHRFVTLHNYGCTFHCPVCSYKLRSGADGHPGLTFPKPERFLNIDEMKQALRQVSVDKMFVMGGEPTVAAELPQMLDFAKNTLKVRTYLGHTNGSKLPMPNLDGANVGLKAWDEKVHLQYTGRDKRAIYDNFENAFRAGLDLKANVVFVPDLVDLDQVEAIAAWLSGLRSDIPFHIMGYIPVPGQPFPRPTAEQMAQAVDVCRKHLRNVASSRLSTEEALNLCVRDDRFEVERIA
jgi:pyruvate formate lyase activating enzyme